MANNVLIVEDNPSVYEPTCEKARDAGFGKVAVAKNKKEAIAIWDASPFAFDVIVLDINLDDIGSSTNRDGWEVLTYFRRKRQDFTVLIYTAALSDQDFSMLGAVMAQPILLFTKSRHTDAFFTALVQLGKAGTTATKKAFFTPEEEKELEVLATSNIPVLLIGPPGSGKSVKAHELAVRSGCPDDRIISVNCAGLSAELAESILFGYVKGAFTGADRNTIGHMMQASGYSKSVLSDKAGTADARSPKDYAALRSKQQAWGAIILDEIGALDYRVQGKLLSVLEGEAIYPLGWTGPGFLPNFRVIAATNELNVMRNRKRFRQDLLRRLTTWVLQCRPCKDEPDSKIEELIRRVRIEHRRAGKFDQLIEPFIESSAVNWLVRQKQKGKLVGGLREINWIVVRAWLFASRRGASSITENDMEQAWTFSAQIYSDLALERDTQGEPFSWAHSKRVHEKADEMRAKLEKSLGLDPGMLNKDSFQKQVARKLDTQADFKKQVDLIVSKEWETLAIALGGFQSKNMAGWYRQSFSRAKGKKKQKQ